MLTLSRPVVAWAGIALAVVLFFAVNIAASVLFRSASLDLTQGGLYSLSGGTRNILAKIEEPITLRFYFSDRVAADFANVRAYGERVRDVLETYAARAGGKIRLEVIDPEPYTVEEDRAAAAGVRGMPTQDGRTIYFGLQATNMIDGAETIPFFIQDRERFLEYDLSSMIYRLNATDRPKLGVVTSLPMDTGAGGLMAALQGQSQPFMIYEQLKDSFDTQFLEQDFDRVPEGIKALMIAHPKGLSQKTLYAIDQFVLRGGKAFVFLDPLSELAQTVSAQAGQAPMGQIQDSTESLGPLLKAWGVRIDPDAIVGDRDNAVRVMVGEQGEIIDYLGWMRLQGDSMNRDDLVTANLSSVNLATVGAIFPAGGATTTLTPLLSSSANATLIPKDQFTAMPDPSAMLRKFQATGERYVIAARISGPVATAFPEGPPKDETPPAEAGAEAHKPEDAAPPPAHIANAEQPASIIIVADADIFDDRFWVQTQTVGGQRYAVPTSGNAELVLNGADNMLGSSDLVALRSRGTTDRPFTVVQNLRKTAEDRFLAEQERLQKKMEATEARIAELQKGAGAEGGAAGLSPEQQREITRFRQELIETRTALRDVQRRLNRDIDALGQRLAVVNMALVPVLVLIAAFAVGRIRASRRRAAAV